MRFRINMGDIELEVHPISDAIHLQLNRPAYPNQPAISLALTINAATALADAIYACTEASDADS